MIATPDEMQVAKQTIFVSYARKDTDRVAMLEAQLAERDVSVWRDTTGLRPGERWREAVERAIGGADLFVFALTADSARSGECAWELVTANELGKLVVTLRLGICQMRTCRRRWVTGSGSRR